MKLFLCFLLVVCVLYVNAGLLDEAKGTIFREVAHQGMKKALGLGHHHHSHEHISGAGGHSGVMG